MKGNLMPTDEEYSEYENPVIEDRTEEVVCELLTQHHQRYEKESAQFLLDSVLEVRLQEVIIRHKRKKYYIETEMSFNQGKSFTTHMLTRLPDRDSDKPNALKLHFVESEAFVILALEERQGHS